MITGLSDFVLFSAAIPDQGGMGHINEKWPTYWISLFEDRDYVCIDAIRKNIWNDDSIPWWYRQNALLFASKKRVSELKFKSSHNDHIPAEVYLLSFHIAVSPPGIRQAVNTLVAAVRSRMRRMIGADG